MPAWGLLKLALSQYSLAVLLILPQSGTYEFLILYDRPVGTGPAGPATAGPILQANNKPTTALL